MYLQNDLFGDTARSGRSHRALDDARMTARAWLKMEEPLGYSIR
jgi:inhibitor of KinA sporulation pathway (predicted exonuclease)